MSALARNTTRAETLTEILDLLNDPGSDVSTLYELDPIRTGGLRVFLSTPVAYLVEEELGRERCFAENGYVLHVL